MRLEVVSNVDRFFPGVATRPRQGGGDPVVTPSLAGRRGLRKEVVEGGCSRERGWIGYGEVGLFEVVELANVVSVWR